MTAYFELMMVLSGCTGVNATGRLCSVCLAGRSASMSAFLGKKWWQFVSKCGGIPECGESESDVNSMSFLNVCRSEYKISIIEYRETDSHVY